MKKKPRVKLMKSFLYLFFILFLLSCIGGKEEKKDAKFSVNGVVAINLPIAQKDMEISKIIKKVRYIKLETKEHFYIGKISKIVFQNDRIYILDKEIAKTLFVFDKQGKALFKINAYGKGIGEYLKPNDFDISPIDGSIWISDLFTNKILVFSGSNGKFLNSKIPGFSFHLFKFISQQEIAFFIYKGENQNSPEDRFTLVTTDSILKVKRNNFVAKPEYRKLYIQLPDQLNRNMGKEVSFYPEFSDSIFVLKDDSIKLKYVVKLEDKLNLKLLDNIDQNSYMNLVQTKKGSLFLGQFIETVKISYFEAQAFPGINKPYFYSKETKKILSAKGIKIDNLNLFFWKKPSAVFNDEFVCTIDASEITAAKGYFDFKDKKLKIDKEFLNLFTTTKELDNPILMLYTLKEF